MKTDVRNAAPADHVHGSSRMRESRNGSTETKMAAKKKTETKRTGAEPVVIARPNIRTVEIEIVGTAPYVQHKFSAKARGLMLAAQIEGPKSKNKKTRKPRDIQQDYKDAMHLDSNGEHGIPAPAFRAAMISACRVAGFTMTKAKLSVFVKPDSFDADDGTPLVKIKGKPIMHESSVRLESGVASVAIRPMWRKWSAVVSVSYDADQFSANDVYNLMERAGLQVGVGEGRPDSKKSNGMGWGTFAVKVQQ